MKIGVSALLSATALTAILGAPALAQSSAEAGSQTETQILDELRVLDTAEAQARQALGSSTITAEDIEKRPPVNDLADIIRREPGINLTNAGSSGVFGNNRQIDIRGMGPENTLILIDGKPVQSRNSVFMGRNGERNTRGDTNWVPAEEVARIDILRGPAAARYGSGAAGGVINIVTKGPAKEFRGSITGYVQQPEDTREGNSKRVNISLSGPIVKDLLSFRAYGNYNKTSGDDPQLNAEAAGTVDGAVPPGGREGVENKDINGMLRFTPGQGQRLDLEAGFSRQGNEYAGEYQIGGGTAPILSTLIGEETNLRKRATGSLNYQGDFSFATAKLIVQYEHTKDTRLNEGQAGAGFGTISDPPSFSSSTTRNWFANGSLDIPFETGGLTHVTTIGGEFRYEYLNDPRNVANDLVVTNPDFDLTGYMSGDPTSSADTFAGYIEDNIIAGNWTVTPGVRFDHHSTFGSNWSPSLSVAWMPIPDLTIKGGIAKAFKAPNLYQSNGNYLYSTMGNGCPWREDGTRYSNCRILGNPDLQAETSVNKEIGIAYAPSGWNVSATYFRNDYDDKIVVSNIWVGGAVFNGTAVNIFQWANAPKAVVEGVEGNLLVPITKGVSFNTNVTYMIQNKNKTTGELLAVVPEYTINSTLDWQVTDQISLLATFTRYGKQVPNGVMWGNTEPTEEQLTPRKPYNLVGLNANFRVTDNFRLGAGVSNLFNQRLFRESSSNSAGANNYNEPGRAFFVTTTASF
ncbi:MAG TPA: FepA family TonB-dependent siderophore receptor [Sphingobium sp.]|nr:FepA family TonB-dependent siderophore receptor [Sphingobium sp.]